MGAPACGCFERAKTNEEAIQPVVFVACFDGYLQGKGAAACNDAA
jgi:hypothetical protein